MIEGPSKLEMYKRRWERYNWAIEMKAKNKVSERREKEVVYKLIKEISKIEIGDGTRKTMNKFVEFRCFNIKILQRRGK